MNPYHKTVCPLCHSELVNTNNISSYAGTVNLYDCPKEHYTFSQNADTSQPIMARIRIQMFHLLYSADETVVYKLDPPPSTKYHYVCVIPGFFPLNWDDLSQSETRLKNLIIFS